MLPSAPRALEERPGTVGHSGTAGCWGGDAGRAQPCCLPSKSPPSQGLPAPQDLVCVPPVRLFPVGQWGAGSPLCPELWGWESCPTPANPSPPHHWAEPISPLQAGGAGGSRGAAAAPGVPCRRVGEPCWMHERGRCICLWFVCRGVPICPCVHISGNKTLHTQPGCSGWGVGAGGAAAHHRLRTPTGPPPPNINFISLVWHKWSWSGPAPSSFPALQGRRIRPPGPHTGLIPLHPPSLCPSSRLPSSELNGVAGEAAGVRRLAEGWEAAGALSLPARGHGGHQEGGPAGRLIQGQAVG